MISSTQVAFLPLWLRKFTFSESGSPRQGDKKVKSDQDGKKIVLDEIMVSGDS